GGHLQGEARFAASADAGEGEQARLAEQRFDLRDLLLPPDETGHLLGQIVGQLRMLQGAQGGELEGKVRVAELEDGFWTTQVTQTVFAQRLETNRRREGIARQFLSGRRNQHLSAMSHRKKARDPVEWLAEVIAVAQF